MKTIYESNYSRAQRNAIKRMQKICLPDDELCPIVKQSDIWFIAEIGNKYAGFGGVRYLYENTWYLCRAGVMPEFVGNGLQKELIRARIDGAIKYGANLIITDCTMDNYGSANSLIGCGFKLFKPCYNWGLDNSIYWRLDI